MENHTPINVNSLDKKTVALDQLRDRLRPFDAVDLINEVQDTISEEWRTMSRNQIDALKLQADIQFRKLSKLLPDLKAMDHSMGDTASKVNFIINMPNSSTATGDKRVL